MRCRVSLSVSHQKDGESAGELVKAVVNFENNNWDHGLTGLGLHHMETISPLYLRGPGLCFVNKLTDIPHINPEGFLFKMNIDKVLNKHSMSLVYKFRKYFIVIQRLC